LVCLAVPPVNCVIGVRVVDAAVLVALIASVSSVVVAVLGALLARGAQRRLQRTQAEHATTLAGLQAVLAERSAERNARRDYEYEARKRLYEAAEPLLFQLAERSEDLQGRIVGLARTARNGDLEPGRGWLSREGYYLRSTVHRLISPVALFHLLQDQLTLVDLDLDHDMRAQYSMSKYLAWSLTDPFVLAACSPVLEYDPYRKSGEAVPFQGVASGLLDAAAQSLIVRGDNVPGRVMRFGEFDDAYAAQDSTVRRACRQVADLLHDFHPRTHPVLWRILVTQAHLCVSFTAARDRMAADDSGAGMTTGARPWDAIPTHGRADYDWRGGTDTAEDSRVLVEPFAAARSYLEYRLAPIFEAQQVPKLTPRATAMPPHR